MVICVLTGFGHSLQSHNDAWLRKLLQTDNLILAVVDEDGGSFDVSFDEITKKITILSTKSSCEALVHVKQHLDMEKILDAEILVPEKNLKECQEFGILLFPAQVYSIVVKSSGSPLSPWDEVKDNFKPALMQCLSCISSQVKVETVQSNMIPSDIFVHGYSKRHGGVSTWPGMDSLNLTNSLRKPDGFCVVEENRRRLCAEIKRDFKDFHVAKANHGNKIWVYEQDAPESYDGIVTKTSGVTVSSPAADCNMLLLADPVVKACGAIHAGWKGILVGIVENAVLTMVTEYGCNPKNILASLGPSLSVCCCEFGAEDSKKFLSISEKVVVWKEGREKPHIDLRLAVRILLEKSGIPAENIDDGINGSDLTSSIAVCTKCDPNKDFFSFRRDGAKFGNQLAFISLK